MRWISALQLEVWARSLSSESQLPGLISDLIRASVEDISSMRFPSGDKGRVRGFDGNLQCQSESIYVPKGRSFWEIGTNEDYRSKASSDIKKRSEEVSLEERKKTSYLFVSPWTWDSSIKDRKLEDWIREQKEEYEWKDIRYIDGSALETWLESNPGVAAWHAKNTIKCAPINGVRSTDEFWEDYIGRFDPKLTESVLVCGREANASALIGKLLEKDGPIRFSADSVDEVVAFAIAAIRTAEPEIRLFLEARTLVVDSLDAGRGLLSNNNLVFLLLNDCAASPGQFYERAPALIPLGRQQRNGAATQLNRPTGYELGTAIHDIGLPEAQAITLARGCGRSLSVLQRLIPSGSYCDPQWVSDPIILPAILAGAWDGNNEHDREIIQKLAGNTDYEELSERLRALSKSEDPPFEIEANVWKVRAPIDAFVHTAQMMSSSLFSKLETSIEEVFAAIEDTLPEEDGFGETGKHKPLHSNWLLEGLANSLLMISVLGEESKVSIGSDHGKHFVDKLISSLPGLNGNTALLASMQDELPLLAEAAPVPFLRALELWLEGDAGLLLESFAEDDGMFSAKTYHNGLLWSLEALAWDPDTFARSVKVLGRLSEIDPGGSTLNRPLNSLKEIFVPWLPNTCATAEQRNAALQGLAKDIPSVGWNLLSQLLPNRIRSSMVTERPQLREAGVNERTLITDQDYWAVEVRIIELVIELAALDPIRWEEILSDITDFPEAQREIALSGLAQLFSSLPEDDRVQIWTKLRDRVNDHIRFPDADWTLNAKQLSPFESLIQQFEPKDPVLSKKWMFDTWDDTDENGLSIEARRKSVVSELFKNYGPEALV